MTTLEQRDTTTRVGEWLGLIGPIVFVALVAVGGFLTDGYSHVSQKISELGAVGAQYAALQNLNFVLLGVSVIGFAWALAKKFGRPMVGAFLVGFFGVVAVLHAFVNCDVGCKGQTTEGLLHNITGVMGFVAVIAGMIVFARRWKANDDWKSHVAFTRACAIVAIVGLVAFVFTQARDIQTYAGIAQRVFAGAFLVWIAATAVRMLRR